MKLKNVLAGVALAASVSLASCGPKDADVQASLQGKEVSGVTVSVAKGVATLTGQVMDDATKAKAEDIAKAEKGVKLVTNSLTVTPPPPAPVVAPITITADDPLAKGVVDATKDFPGVTASVKDGIITVTGKATADKWKTLKMRLDGLKPKKVDASGLSISK